MGANSDKNNVGYPVTVKSEGPNAAYPFRIEVSNLPSDVCIRIHNMNPIAVDKIEPIASECGDGVLEKMTFYFDEDFSSISSGSSSSGGKDNEEGGTEKDPSSEGENACLNFTTTTCRTACKTENGKAVYTYANNTTSCGTAGLCDGQGSCVECSGITGCLTYNSTSGTCKCTACDTGNGYTGTPNYQGLCEKAPTTSCSSGQTVCGSGNNTWCCGGALNFCGENSKECCHSTGNCCPADSTGYSYNDGCCEPGTILIGGIDGGCCPPDSTGYDGAWGTGCCKPNEYVTDAGACCPTTSTGWSSFDMRCCTENEIQVEDQGSTFCCPPGSTGYDRDGVGCILPAKANCSADLNKNGSPDGTEVGQFCLSGDGMGASSLSEAKQFCLDRGMTLASAKDVCPGWNNQNNYTCDTNPLFESVMNFYGQVWFWTADTNCPGYDYTTMIATYNPIFTVSCANQSDMQGMTIMILCK
jgi:hypothetical protein